MTIYKLRILPLFLLVIGPVSYTHLTLPSTSRRQRQMCIRDRAYNAYFGLQKERHVAETE